MSNSPDIKQEPLDGEQASSPWIMLVTMSLLIAGFVLASVLMIDHVRAKRQGSDEPLFNFKALTTKAKSMANHAPAIHAASADENQPPKPSPIENLKQLVNNASGSSDGVRWPRLKLSGFGNGTESFAIINGEQVHPGQYAGKVKVVEVRAHDVIVEYMGEQKTLTLDVHD